MTLSTNCQWCHRLTTGTTHVDLVVLAVYLLSKEGGKTAWDTEDIAVRAFELSPARFAWRKRKDQINLELVRVSLSDAKKTEKGGRIEGSGRTGWSLSPEGHRWANGAADVLLLENHDRSRELGRGGSIDEQRWRRERERLVGCRAWAAWSENPTANIPMRDVREVFRIDDYADDRMRAAKIMRLQDLFAGDEAVCQFLATMAGHLKTGDVSDG